MSSALHRAAVLATLIAGCAWTSTARLPAAPGRFAEGGAAHVDLGPVPTGLVSSAADDCGRCHAEIAAEWRGSLHARAWTDPIFQEAYAAEPLAECRNCHAPENGGRFPTGRAAHDGVSCAACHVRAGAVLAADDPASPRAARGLAPHPVLATRDLADSAFCAGCHQFNFLGFLADADGRGHHVPTEEAQQDTYGEWQASASATAGETCQGCHMPWVASPGGGRHRSHAFRGGFDPQLVRQAVSAEVTARETALGVEVSVRIRPGRTGHAFPTGDVFRRAELRAWLPGLSAAPLVFPLARAFADRFHPQPDGGTLRLRAEVSDTRMPPPGNGPPAIRRGLLPLPPSRGPLPELAWAFDYHIMPTPIAAASGGEPVHTVPIAAGRVPVTPLAPAP
jgi:hypothetical protein